MTLLKTLLFTLVVPGTVAGGIPYLLLVYGRSLPPLPAGPLRYAGGVLLVLGVLIYLWCAAEFTFRGHGTPSPTDSPRELVVTGLYRYSRNPMYVGIASTLFGTALFFQSAEVLLYATLVLLGFHLRVIYYEEPKLERSFGASFRRYRQEVPRWLLRLA
ncbi:isoprenylcysteine carboxylmethyltransferase family protein [soil metagenome]